MVTLLLYSRKEPGGSLRASLPDAVISLRGSDKQIRVVTIDIQDTKKRYTSLRITVSTNVGDLEGMNPKLHFGTPTKFRLIFDQPLEGKMIKCSFLP